VPAHGTLLHKDSVMKNGSEAMKNNFETMTKGFEQFSAFGKGSVEAYVQAATVMAKTFERVNGEVFNFSKQQMEDSMAAFKAVAGAKSLHEAWELQSDFAKSAMDAYVAQATKLNDLWLDAAKQAAEPFSARLAEVTEKMQEFKAPFARAAE
jgi:phasin family protein